MLSNLWNLRRFLPTLLLFAQFAQIAGALSSTGSNVLVVVEPKVENDLDKYRSFFDGLKNRGYNLRYRKAKDPEPELRTDDVPNFDHIIFFAPTTKSFARDITPQSIVTLVSQNVNVLVVLSSSTHTPLTSLAAEFGLIYPPPGTGLITHFPPREEKDIVEIDVSSSPLMQYSKSAKGEKKILYKGAAHAYSSPPPHSLFKILSAPAESFSVDSDGSNNDKGHAMIVDAFEKGGEGLWAGSGMGVVSGFIANNGARVAFAGGIEMFHNEFVNGKTVAGEKSVNGAFVQELTKWVFQESRVLRIKSVEHHLASDTSPSATINASAPRETYTTNDHITYTIKLETYNSEKNDWVPYAIPKGDVLQLEYTMLDPHIRTNLSRVISQPGTYTTTFRSPDRHGVFKLHFTYFRKGFTPLISDIITPLVPPRHDGYPRFLSAGWPFYAGAISTSVGFLVFCVVWLGGGSGVEGVRGKKKRE